MPRAQRGRGRRKPCDTCLDLDYELMRSPGAGHFHPQDAWSDHLTKVNRVNIYLLDESKKKGCQICFAVLKAIDLLTRDWLPEPTPPEEEGGPTDTPAAAPTAAPGPGPAPTLAPAPAPATGSAAGSPPPTFAFLSMINALALERSWVQLLVRKASFSSPEIAHPVEVICNLVVSGRVSRPSGGAFIKVHTVHFGPNGDHTIRFGFEIYSHPDHPAPWPAFHPARHVPLKLPSERRKSLLAEWIKGCNDNHHACRVTTLSSLPEPGRYPIPKRLAGDIDIAAFMEVKGRLAHYSPESRRISSKPPRKPPPKRLLDLSGNPRNCIRLVDADNVEGEYATLSHSRAYTYSSALHLNADTINKMKKRISWADLVPAFQDAVVVAAEQGIRYLWIDWLCIMMDDLAETNWHIENLHEIYGQSYLNIALSQARDFRRSSLGKRWLNPSRDAEVKTWQIDLAKDGKMWPVYVRSKFYNSHGTFQFSKSSLHTTSRVAEDYIRRFPPMFKTAWVFQERILAPRTVHFNTSEMLWECRSCIQCECSLNVCDTLSLGTLGSSKFSLSQLGVALVPIRLDKDTQLRQLWRHMWPVYSHLRTTHPNRRLHALLGLATMFQKLLGQSFVAGLFANTPEELARELLWGVERNNSSSSVPSGPEPSLDTYKFCGLRVPSWTWASMIARWPDAVGHPEIVRRGKFRVNPNFDVVQVSTVPPIPGGEDHPFNADQWKLHLRGEIILGKISTWDRRNRHYQFVPSNVVQFPPSLPPPAVPLQPGRRHYVPVGVGSIEIINVGARRPQASIILPPILPAPPPVTPSPTTSATTSRSSSPEIMDTPVLPRISRPLSGQDLISSMGMFTPDCDTWDDRRKDTANYTMDGIVTANHTYAYFLLLGTIDMLVTDDFTDHTDVGLVLRRAENFHGSGTKVSRGTFQRVGYFTAPRVASPRGLGDFFKDAQVQDVEIV